MVIISVDPGVQTGYAVWDQYQGWLGSFEATDYEFMKWIHHYDNDTNVVIVCEDFRITPTTLKKTWMPHSLYQIGALKYLSHHRGWEFHLQQPVDAKRLVTDAKLDAIRWRNNTIGGHANDATRHLLLYLLKWKWISPEMFVNVDA